MIDENEQLFQVVSIMDLKIFFGGSKTFDFELQLILKNHPRKKQKSVGLDKNIAIVYTYLGSHGGTSGSTLVAKLTYVQIVEGSKPSYFFRVNQFL